MLKKILFLFNIETLKEFLTNQHLFTLSLGPLQQHSKKIPESIVSHKIMQMVKEIAQMGNSHQNS